MLPPSQMLVRLDVATRVHHPEADAPWLDLMAREPTRTRYIDLLVATYGFEAPIEASLSLTPQVASVVDLRHRSRTGAIVQDLLALGMTPSKIARLPQCSRVVPFRDSGEALGWLYVVERATLLHEAILRYVQGRLPYVYAWSYLNSYDGRAGLRWQEFGRMLDEVATTPAITEQILAGARAAFACHLDWHAAKSVALAGG
ncbi:MAG: biliverdin-producing heme oxygenase [Kofleriaceae bacterium]|nr:biliverdin-producing heme oxygenase [Kofleriaceae bacterium]